MSMGTSAAPSDRASQSIWMTPKTRAITSSGTARCTSVSPDTSTRAFDSEHGEHDDRSEDVGPSPIAIKRESHERDSRHERRAQPLGSGERQGSDRPENAPTPMAALR